MCREKFRVQATRWISRATGSRCWKPIRERFCGSESANGQRRACPPSRAAFRGWRSTARSFVRAFVRFVIRFAGLGGAQTFELEMPVQFADSLRIIAPVGRDLHEHPEENLGPQQRFQFVASFRSDFFHHPSFTPLDDFLLL